MMNYVDFVFIFREFAKFNFEKVSDIEIYVFRFSLGPAV